MIDGSRIEKLVFFLVFVALLATTTLILVALGFSGMFAIVAAAAVVGSVIGCAVLAVRLIEWLEEPRSDR